MRCKISKRCVQATTKHSLGPDDAEIMDETILELIHHYQICKFQLRFGPCDRRLTTRWDVFHDQRHQSISDLVRCFVQHPNLTLTCKTNWEAKRRNCLIAIIVSFVAIASEKVSLQVLTARGGKLTSICCNANMMRSTIGGLAGALAYKHVRECGWIEVSKFLIVASYLAISDAGQPGHILESSSSSK